MNCKLSPGVWKIVQTLLICPVFFQVGSMLGVLGPTLLDLQLAIEATLKQTAYVVPVRAVSYALGSILAGIVRKLLRLDTALGLSLSAAAASMGLAPWCDTLSELVLTVGASGFFMGAVDVFVTVYLLELWKEKSGTILQIAYFFYGLGAFVIPLFVAPFLIPLKRRRTPQQLEVIYEADDLPIEIPYAVLGICGVCWGIVFAVITHFSVKPEAPVVLKKANEKSDKFLVYLCAVGIAGLVIHLHAGTVASIGTMLQAFLVKGHAKLTLQSAAFLTAAFWASCAFSCLGTLVLVHFFGPARTIFLEMTLVVVGNAILVFLGHRLLMLWVSVIILGIGYSSVFGLIVAYLQQNLSVNSNVMSYFLISSCFAEFLYPSLVAAYVEKNPEVFVHIAVTCGAAMCLSTAVLSLVCRKL